MAGQEVCELAFEEKHDWVFVQLLLNDLGKEELREPIGPRKFIFNHIMFPEACPASGDGVTLWCHFIEGQWKAAWNCREVCIFKDFIGGEVFVRVVPGLVLSISVQVSLLMVGQDKRVLVGSWPMWWRRNANMRTEHAASFLLIT